LNRAIRTTVAFLLIVRLVDETTGFLAPASVEQFRADLGIGYGVAAAMFVAYGCGGLFGVVAVARSDGKSRKTVTWSGAMVLALSLVIIGAAQSAPWLLVGAFLDATGATMLVHGGEISIANALAAAGLGHNLERVLARSNVFAVVGDAVGPLVVAATRAAGLGWRPLFFAVAALVALYGVALTRLEFPEPVVAAADVGEELVPVHRQSAVWLVALAAAATMPLDEAYLATVLAFAEVWQGFSSSGAALLGATFVAGGLVSLTALTGVIARTSMATLLTVSAFGLSGVMVVAAVGPGWVLVPVGLVHSGLLMATWLALQTTVLRANPGREGATKVIVEVLETASFSVVVAIGVLADRAGLRWAMAAFAVLPLLLLPVARAYRRRQ
jgi:MFS family permease